MNMTKMKSILFLMLVIVALSLQDQTGPSTLLVDDIAAFKANDIVRIDSLEDGTVKIGRTYSNGISSLSIRISTIAAYQKEELPKQVQRLVDVFEGMAAEGKMEAEVQNTGTFKGVLTFFEGTAGGILIVKGNYLVEYQLSDASGVKIAKAVMEGLNLSSL